MAARRVLVEERGQLAAEGGGVDGAPPGLVGDRAAEQILPGQLPGAVVLGVEDVEEDALGLEQADPARPLAADRHDVLRLLPEGDAAEDGDGEAGEGEDVGARIDVVADDLLGRRPLEGGGGGRRVDGDVEAVEGEGAPVGEQHVAGRQIGVDQAAGVEARDVLGEVAHGGEQAGARHLEADAAAVAILVQAVQRGDVGLGLAHRDAPLLAARGRDDGDAADGGEALEDERAERALRLAQRAVGGREAAGEGAAVAEAEQEVALGAAILDGALDGGEQVEIEILGGQRARVGGGGAEIVVVLGAVAGRAGGALLEDLGEQGGAEQALGLGAGDVDAVGARRDLGRSLGIDEDLVDAHQAGRDVALQGGAHPLGEGVAALQLEDAHHRVEQGVEALRAVDDGEPRQAVGRGAEPDDGARRMLELGHGRDAEAITAAGGELDHARDGSRGRRRCRRVLEERTGGGARACAGRRGAE